MSDKKRNFLVIYTDPSELYMEDPNPYIINAIDENEVDTILNEKDSDEFRQYKRNIYLLSDVERLNRKELNIRQIMEMISNPAHFAESVKLLESMLVNSKISYGSLEIVLSPYFQFVERTKIVNPVETVSSLWKKALASNTTKKAFRIVLRYFPKNKIPFNHDSQTYDVYIDRTDDSYKKLTFKNINTTNGNGTSSYVYDMVEFFEEIRKIIPDLPARIEERIIEIM